MDAPSFEALFATAAKPAWVVAAGILMDPHASDDALQEVAVVAWQKRFDFQIGTNFTAWLCQIARHISLRQRRDRHGMQSIERIEEPTLETNAHASTTPAELAKPTMELMERLGLSGPLARALATLDEDARACLLLRTVLDVDYAEIAAILQIPEGTAMSHVHRSRKRLMELLSDPMKATN
jgi:RNA polymerase sigma-70 factor, ECF subfamily